MKTVLEVLKRSTTYLEQHGVENARRQAEDIISDALGIKRLNLYLEHDRPLNEAELTECRNRLQRRGRGEPAQYIHGQVEFCNCTILVTPAVLIPRQETEILVEQIIQELSGQDLTGKTLWDVCCGSGYIGIALKKRFPALKVVLSDLSPEALEVARKNAALNSVEVTCLQGDLLKPFKGSQAHYLTCNPPYVAEGEFESLDASVKNFEPRMALIGGKTGLEFYERLATELPGLLFPGAKVWFEIGTGQGEAIQKLFNRSPWKYCAVKQDWAGHDRFFFLENE